MKTHIAPHLVGLILASALSVSAQTFTEDISGSPAVNSFTRVDGLPLGEVLFNNVEGGGISDPYSVDPIGVTVTEITTAQGTFTAFDICAELFVGPNTSSNYSVSSGLGALSGTQQLQIAKLLSNTLGDFNTFYTGGDRNNAGIIGAAIQLAYWEIIEDPDAIFFPSLDENDGVLAGEISISGFSDAYAGDTRAAMELAQVYLGNLSTWNDEGGLSYYSAVDGSSQNRLWVTATAIPEPAVTLLSSFGLLMLLRRRRA